MAERYSRLFTLKTDLYTLGSPITVKAGALLKDNETGNIIAQLKFKNIQDKVVKLIKVSIKSFDSLGRPLGEDTEYQYLDLSEGRDNEFGSKNAIFLPNGFARSFSVNVTEVGFDDNTLWQGWANAVWESLPVLESIEDKYDSETLKQIQLNYGNSCQYIPAKERGVWFCSCGAVNIDSEENCHKCNCSADALFSIDYEKMTADAKERLECERKNAIYLAAINSAKQHPIDRLNTEGLEKAIEQLNTIIGWKDSKEKIEEYTKQIAEIKAQQEANKIAAAKKSKKNKIIAAIAIPSIIAVIAFVIVLFKVIIPNNQYNDAIALMNAGKYEEATAAFEAMGGYKDSDGMIFESRYLQATDLMENGEYEAALYIFDALGEYKDSSDMWTKCQYLLGKALMDAGKYVNAADIFGKISNYEKSSDLKSQCCLEAAKQFYADKEYYNAIKWYEKVNSYDKNAEFYTESCYNYGVQQIDSGNYSIALLYLQKAGNRSGISDQIMSAKYGYVNANKNSKNICTYEYLKDLKAVNYKDSKKIFDELYKWTVVLEFANEDADDYTTIEKSIYKNVYYFHVGFRLNGGEPGESATFYHKVIWPDGTTSKSSWFWLGKSSGGFLGCEWPDGLSVDSGTLKFNIYEKETNELVGSFSFYCSSVPKV